MAKRTRRSLEFKRQAVERMRSCEDVKALAEELKLNRSLLYSWKRQLEGWPEKRRANLNQTRETSEQRKLWEENQRLKQLLGEKVLEADFFAAALRRIEEQRQKNTVTGGMESTPKSERGASEPVSRAGYYRRLEQTAPEEEQMEVRAAIQAIYLAHRRRYGRRRITAELRRRGMRVDHKRVGRLMREDNLLVLQRRVYVKTTESRHEYEVYLNVAARMELTGINQLWVADITYIRLRGEFVYLAVILDRYSRSVVGWSLDRNMTVRLTLAALQQAIEKRPPPQRTPASQAVVLTV